MLRHRFFFLFSMPVAMLDKKNALHYHIPMKITLHSCLGILAFACSVQAQHLYLDPAGSDTNPGTRSQPLASLERARDLIREARKQGDLRGWRVTLKQGRYERTTPFMLTADDRSTIYEGQRGATVITGGFLITNWVQESEAVWSASIPGLKDQQCYFEQLFVNNQRAVRSRWPKPQTNWKFGEDRTDFFTPAALRQVVTTNENKSIRVEQYLTARPGELDLLRTIPSDELPYAALVVHHNWDTTRRMMLDFNTASNTLKVMGGIWKHWNPWRTNSLCYIENVRSAFTEPGEWFLSPKDGKVYYRPRPGEKMTTLRIEAPRNGMTQLMVMNGCTNIIFKRLQFSVSDTPRRAREMNTSSLPDARPNDDFNKPGPTQFEPCQAAGNTEALILADNITACTFSRCTIQNTGEYGIWIRGNCHSNTIERCTIQDTGAGCIRLCDLPNRKNSSFNVIKNCSLVKGGRFHAAGTAVWIGEGTDNVLTHNHIADHYYTGISIGWNWGYRGKSFRNEISYNLVELIGQAALGDMGGFYSLGTQTGTRVANNVFRNIDSFTYGGWGIYPDEGSEGLIIENNLVYNVKDGGFHQHYGKENTVRNNIFAFSRKDQIATTRTEPHTSVYFTNNIVYWDKPQDAFERYRTEKVKIVWNRNIWFCETGEPRFRGMTFAEWQATGKDTNSFVINPRFKDPAKRDFRFASDEAYTKIGFKPFDYAQAGIEK